MSEAEAPLRVMHVIEAMHQGGAESLVIEHVRHAGPGVRTWVCALNRGGPALEAARALGAEVAVMRRPGLPTPLARVAGLFALASHMRRARIDVVNGHNPTGALYAVAAAALAGVRATVRTEHSIHYEGRHSAFYPSIERAATARTAAVICVCNAVRQSHARRMPGLEARFVTVFNGIDDAAGTGRRDATRRALGLEPADEVVLNVGSLTRQKAQHVLVEAIARVARSRPRVRLLIAGEGSRRGELESRIATLGLGDRVTLLGPRNDAADLMDACDVFALSSEREGLSVTLLEAMRAARPAVATAVGGNGEAVADGENGRLVGVGNPEALAGALGELLSDSALREAMGRSARRRYLERFTATRMVASTEAVYRRALGRETPADTATAAEERHATA